MEEAKRRRLTAKRKFEIYLETKKDGAKIGEILRREGIHLNDLREIEELVERGAIGSLKSRGPGRVMRRKIDPLEYDQLKRELKDKEKAMSDLRVEYTLLKKSERLESSEGSKGPLATQRRKAPGAPGSDRGSQGKWNVSYGMICESLGMSPRRLERWKQDRASPEIKERNVKPYHAMTEEEKIAVKEIVANEKHADESTRGLSVRLMEERGLYVSHVSIWGYERSIGVSGYRGHRRNQTKRPEKPDTDFATGPNHALELGHHETEDRPRLCVLLSGGDPGHLEPEDRGMARGRT